MAYQQDGSGREQLTATQAVAQGTATGSEHDTIVAIATAAGAGAVAIVRLSGSRALDIALRITSRQLRPRLAELCDFLDANGRHIDTGIALAFPAPASYTGEDVVELHCHGGAVVSDWLVETALAFGARAARAGEFTLRAFLNDKLDLAQAAAVADLIASDSRAAARSAMHSLQGRFSDAVKALQAQLTRLRAHLEAHLDFPDEEIEPEALEAMLGSIDTVMRMLQTIAAEAKQGAVLRDGLNVALAGKPNAGKSSLLNRLAGYDAAIVTELPGTTRDALRERIVLDRLPVTIVDTAGLRATEETVEAEGQRRARAASRSADHVLWIMDAREPREPEVAAARSELGDGVTFTIIENKIDLGADEAGTCEHDGITHIRLSALTGRGIDALLAHLRQVAGLADVSQGAFSARRCHLDALRRAETGLANARQQLSEAPELAAEELRNVQSALSELTGELTSDDLLGEIFSSFCIGK